MFWKKKIECVHLWHHLQDDYISVNQGYCVEVEDGSWIFCSKCEKEELVYRFEWVRIKKKQEILNINEHRHIKRNKEINK